MKVKKVSNIMITGAGGFLGMEILRQLNKDSNYNIIALTSNKEKIHNSFSQNKISCYKLKDLNNKSIPWSDIDIIIHCAFARTQEGHSLAHALDLTGNILSKSINEGTAKGFINISSQSVYGNFSKPLWRENTQVSPDSMYALAKYATEIITNIKCDKRLIKYTNIRLSSLVGPGLNVRLVSRFILNAIKGEPIKISGGKQTLSFMYVKDAAEGIIALINTPTAIWKELYNFGSTNRYNILEIAQIVKKIAPEYTSKTVKIEIEQKDVSLESGMESSLFYKDTGWKPKYDMNDIVRSLFEYHTKPNDCT